MSRFTAELSTPRDGVQHLVLEFDAPSDGWFLYGHASIDDAPQVELWHMTKEDAQEQALSDYGVSIHEWASGGESDDTPTRDVNGTVLQNGDDVTLIKDLDVKGAGVTLKRGTTVKNITLTGNPEEIDCRTKEVRGLVLKSCFVKKL